MRLWIAGTLALLLCTVTGTSGQQQPPTFRSQIDAIAVDTVVVDRAGNPVGGLTANDFEILENGKPQALNSFAEVHVPMAAAATRPEPEIQTNTDSDGRLYVIAVAGMNPFLAMRAAAVLRPFITDHVAANDLVSIVGVGSAPASFAQDFTSDKGLLLQALDRFRETGYPLPPAAQRRLEAEALRNLLESIGRIPQRRKALLYVTDRMVDVMGVIDGSEHAGVADMGAMRDGLSVAMRGNVAIYTIDPAGLPGVGAGGESEGGGVMLTPDTGSRQLDFRTMASLTGGFAIVNSNDYKGAFARIVRENSSYYMLGYTSSNAKRDGKYRRLDVRVKRPDLTVRAREGYIAPALVDPPLHTNAATGMHFDPAVASALEQPIESDAVPMWVRVDAPATTAKGTSATVVVNAEFDARAIDAAPGAEVELGVVAVSADGATIRAQRQRFVADASATASGRLRGSATLTLPPGRYQLRVAGAAVAASHGGSVLYDLNLPQTQ